MTAGPVPAAAAAAAAAAGDHATAQDKSKEAQQHAAQAQTLSQAARTPPPWPMVVPSDLPPFPGSGWRPGPVTTAIRIRAEQLLPELWKFGAGTWKAEKTGPTWVVYIAQQMGDKRGVVAFTPVAGAIPSDVRSTEEDAATSAARHVTVTPGAALPTQPASTSRFSTLRRGSRGPSVVWLQQKLHISADGDFGRGTEAAVMAFQQSHGLSPDGVVGPATWAALGGSAQAA